MALSLNEKWILVAIFAVVGIAAVYFEVRFMRGKSKEIASQRQDEDEAHNAILTTRSVMNVMQTKGADTRKSESLLLSARQALRRHEYQKCMDLCEQARNELTNPTKPKPGAPTESSPDDLEKVAESIVKSDSGPSGVDLYSGSKLVLDKDGNYLSAKFEINTAKIHMKEAVDKGQNTSEAQGLLTDAEGAFVAGNYTKALSLALRARRAISSDAAVETIPLKRVEDEEEAEAEPMADDESGPPAQRCRNCNALLDFGDTFCASCGAKVHVERICENCGAKSKPSDKFCRKCGASLG